MGKYGTPPRRTFDRPDLELLGLKEAARVLDVSYELLRRAVNDGRVQAVRIGARYKLSRVALAYISENGIPETPSPLVHPAPA